MYPPAKQNIDYKLLFELKEKIHLQIKVVIQARKIVMQQMALSSTTWTKEMENKSPAEERIIVFYICKKYFKTEVFINWLMKQNLTWMVSFPINYIKSI